MPSSSSHTIILASSLLLLFALPACYADLMCYVCDDCAKMETDTPLLPCNEEFFNPSGSTEASTVTTTEASTTEADPTTTTMESTTDEPSTSTTEISSSTEELTTTPEQSTESTEQPIPTPETPGPVETTPTWPTPPAEDLSRLQNTTHLVQVSSESSTQSIPAVRQRRALVDTDFTYHCYSIQKKINGSSVTDRGCSRVSTYEAVCDQLTLQNNDTEISNCDPCSMNACNGSTTLQASLVASLLVALIAAALQSN